MPAILATAFHWLVGSPLLSAKMPGEQGVRIISVTTSSKVMRGGFPRSYLADSERLLREDPGLLRRLVEAGLRGQLKTGSLLTGQLYAELTKVEAFPLEQIGTDLSATLTEVRALVDSAALDGSLVELQRTLERIGSATAQLDQDVIPELNETVIAARRVLANLNGLIGL